MVTEALDGVEGQGECEGVGFVRIEDGVGWENEDVRACKSREASSEVWLKEGGVKMRIGDWREETLDVLHQADGRRCFSCGAAVREGEDSHKM